MSRIINITTISFIFFLIYSLTTPPPIAAADGGDEKLTAYDVLKSYDFPVGLLPQGVTGYDLDKATGQFHAYLSGSCSFSLEGSYQLKYKSTITGSISKDRIRNLSGISVKILFVWVNIVEVVRRGDQLRFSVGIASADFGIEDFEECPQCGCGFDCNGNGQVRMVTTNPFVNFFNLM